jgi:predicted dehydrogenase
MALPRSASSSAPPASAPGETATIGTARLRTATIGVGHFGRYHAQKYAAAGSSELVAVCDADPVRAEQVAAELGTRAVSDYHELLGAVDAVSIVVPTHAHHEIAKAFLDQGVHVLVEKPIASTIEQADDLIETARKRNVVLQVGHLERFSSVRQAMEAVVRRPLYIEANRISPFRLRGTDVSIVLDLMIHDIDLVLSLVNAAVIGVDAVGTPVLSALEDIASCRIRFANGCVASITASRISVKNERKMRIFQPNAYVSVDFLTQKLLVAQKDVGDDAAPNISIEEKTLVEGDSLQRQIEAFLASISGNLPPVVSGEDGRLALATAIQIRDSLEEHRLFVHRQLEAEAL